MQCPCNGTGLSLNIAQSGACGLQHESNQFWAKAFNLMNGWRKEGEIEEFGIARCLILRDGDIPPPWSIIRVRRVNVGKILNGRQVTMLQRNLRPNAAAWRQVDTAFARARVAAFCLPELAQAARRFGPLARGHASRPQQQGGVQLVSWRRASHFVLFLPFEVVIYTKQRNVRPFWYVRKRSMDIFFCLLKTAKDVEETPSTKHMDLFRYPRPK